MTRRSHTQPEKVKEGRKSPDVYHPPKRSGTQSAKGKALKSPEPYQAPRRSAPEVEKGKSSLKSPEGYQPPKRTGSEAGKRKEQLKSPEVHEPPKRSLPPVKKSQDEKKSPVGRSQTSEAEKRRPTSGHIEPTQQPRSSQRPPEVVQPSTSAVPCGICSLPHTGPQCPVSFDCF